LKAGRLIFSSLTYYWKKNLLLAVGIAISGAVITGAMMVGDSVKYSLNLIVEQRLGNVTHVM
jgi:putative ABC transport system permease protein